MGDGDSAVAIQRQSRAVREKSLTSIYAVMACLIALILIQFLLLMVAVEGFLGGNSGVLLPSAAVSGACFAGSCWMIRFLRPSRTGRS